MHTIKIIFFAGLKDHFGNEKELDFKNYPDVELVVKKLIAEMPDSEELLSLSRFAIDGEFVEMNDTVKKELVVLPPASGG